MTPNTPAEIAREIHAAYRAYRDLEWRLFEAIEVIVGEGRLSDAHVEFDSQYDNSVEVALVNGEKLTDEERKKIKELGFSIVWSDEKSDRSEHGSGCLAVARYAEIRAIERCAGIALKRAGSNGSITTDQEAAKWEAALIGEQILNSLTKVRP